MNSEDLWGMHVENLGVHNQVDAFKWFSQQPPEEQKPINLTATGATSSGSTPEYDDREKFRRKFATAALQAGIPVPVHLSPKGVCNDWMVRLPENNTSSGRFEPETIIAPSDSHGIINGFFPSPYRSQITGIHEFPPVASKRQMWRCSVEGCTKRFKSKQALRYHDIVRVVPHLYFSKNLCIAEY